MQKFRFLIVMILVGASVAFGAEIRKLGSNDLEWATPNAGTNTTTTSPQQKVVTKIDAKVIPFQNADGYVDDLVNGTYTLTLKPLSITGNGSGTISGYTIDFPAASLSGSALIPLSVPPSALQASSWAGTGTSCYRDDGSWGSCGEGGGDNVTLPITGAMIDNGTLNLNHFPADLRPIKYVGALPECLSATYPAGSVVYLSADYKLYTCLDNGSWQTTVQLDDISNVIDNNALRANIIGTAQFAQGVRPVQLVSADPALPDANYPAGSFIFNIASNTLRKTSNGLSWDNAVTSFNASNIAGQLTAAQIASIAATQVTGQLTSDQIASLDGSKVTGEILATELADGSVTTPKLVAGAVTTEKVAAGTITSDLLAANSVVAGKISANAVEAGDIAANAVTAGTIAANAVTAGTVSAGAIGATEIASGAIVAGKIGADAIVAANLQAGAVTAGKIGAGAVTAGTIASNVVTSDAIVAGAVSASKIATDAIAANNIQAGAVTAAKIATNTITTDKLATHNSVSSDGNYMVSTGWYLSPSYLYTRYPSPASPYFVADGQTHYYAWNGSYWYEIVNIGQKTSGADYYTISVHRDGARQFGVYSHSEQSIGLYGLSGTSYGVVGYAYGAGGVGGVFQSNSGYPVVLTPNSTAELPSVSAGQLEGSIFVSHTNKNAFIAVSNAAGYSSWRTLGIANANLTTYDFAVGSQCIYAIAETTYLALKVTTGAGGWATQFTYPP